MAKSIRATWDRIMGRWCRPPSGPRPFPTNAHTVATFWPRTNRNRLPGSKWPPRRYPWILTGYSDVSGRHHRRVPSAVIMPFMDTNQTRIVELLREVHLIAFKEIERLNLRIAELESRSHHQPEVVVLQTAAKSSFTPKESGGEMMNETQVADFLNMSLASLRKWRLFRKGPKFLKIGRSVRYRRQDRDVAALVFTGAVRPATDPLCPDRCRSKSACGLTRLFRGFLVSHH